MNGLRPSVLAVMSQLPLPLPRELHRRPTRIGQVFTFGSAVSGELGLGKSVHERRKPGNVKHLNPHAVVAIECGGQHSLALDQHGQVWSWGINDQGALGRSTDEDVGANSMRDDGDSSDDDDDGERRLRGDESWVPNRVSIVDDEGKAVCVVQMVCADSFSAVLTTEGHVYAWGSFRDPSGVLGFSKNMEKQSQRLPRRITAFRQRIVLLGSGENHVFAVAEDDTLWAFGANDENQLGRRASSRFKNNLEPYQIRASHRRNLSLHNIVKITGGSYHTLYINAKGELYAFGCNNCGQLGLGDLQSHLNGPERVEFYVTADAGRREILPPIVDIAAGESHSLAVSVDGRIFSFGANLEGQLGYVTGRPLFGDERDHQPAPIPASGSRDPGKKGSRTSPPSSGSSSLEGSPAKHLHPVDAAPGGLNDRESYKLKYQPVPREIPREGDPVDGSGGFAPISQDPCVMVDAQSRFSACITASGRLYTWGSGHCYQLGNEEMDDEVTPYKVELKTRKSFWVRCGGQFIMFLLEPKQEDASNRDATSVPMDSQPTTDKWPEGQDPNGPISPENQPSFQQYRSNDAFLPSSLPTSPVRRRPGPYDDPLFSPRHHRMSRRSSSQSPEKPTILDRSSPTENLLETFENVCVSPEKKRVRVEDDVAASSSSVVSGSQQFSMEEKMAPWSPSKNSYVIIIDRFLGLSNSNRPRAVQPQRTTHYATRQPRNLLSEMNRLASTGSEKSTRGRVGGLATALVADSAPKPRVISGRKETAAESAPVSNRTRTRH